MKLRAWLLIIICGIFPGGCMPLTASQPTPAIYALHAPQNQKETETVMRIVLIPEPEVPSGFDTNKIALYLYNGRRLDYYKNAVWAGRLGKILQDVIIQSASSIPGTLAVTPDSGLPASYEILAKVNDFEPVYAADPQAPPQLKVSIDFRLISLESKKVLLNVTLSARKLASANTQTAITSGLESLLLQVNARAFRKIYSPL
jgi:ABC-type uncharacterized transport system auxiliary subunit